MAKAPSRPVRWTTACSEAREAMEELESLREQVNEDLQNAMQELVDGMQEALDKANDKLGDPRQKAIDALQDLRDLQEEYQEWYDNMPYQLQEGATGEKLSEIANLDLEWEPDIDMTAPEIEDITIELDLSDLEGVIDEAEAAELPQGFGKD